MHFFYLAFLIVRYLENKGESLVPRQIASNTYINYIIRKYQFSNKKKSQMLDIMHLKYFISAIFLYLILTK